MPNYLLEINQDPNDTLPINGTYSRSKTQSYGLQTLLLELNATGVPVAYHADKLDVRNGYLQTDWYPNSPHYTISVVDNGVQKILTHGPDKYYVNNVDTTPVPALPSSSTKFRVDDKLMGGVSVLSEPILIDLYEAKPSLGSVQAKDTVGGVATLVVSNA